MNIILPQSLIAPLPSEDAASDGHANGSARLHHRFVRQAARKPDAVAVLHDGQSLTYRALDERSNRIAHLLRGQGVGRGDRVGICLERSPDLVAALIGVLKAGAAYIPLDPAYPRGRLELMLADSDPVVLVGSPNCPAFNVRTLTLCSPALHDAPSTPLAESDDEGVSALACVFFTSGSTGRPKGVMLGHTATGFIDWSDRTLGRDALARVAATTSVCFDPSIFEIFAPLSVGGTVILKRDLLEPFAPGEEPSLLNGVPSAFAELGKEDRIPNSVRVINVGGERLSAPLARMIHRHSNGIQLWNHYGPTETTICASVALVAPDVDSDPAIGRPIAGAVFHVLDEAGNPVGAGGSGELYIGGTGVALGYLNQSALTAERFLPDPFLPGGRMYRTGDIVRATSDGDFLFLGREGRQIKLHGFRVELDEIEAALIRLEGIDGAATLATYSPNGLVTGVKAVIAAREDWTLSRLRRSLRSSLPRHMLPNRLVVLRTLPLTPSGKVDRAALLAVEPAAPARIAARDPWMPPLTEAILTVFRNVLDQPALQQTDDFFDHGGDSLQAMDALLRIETLLGQPMPAWLMAKEADAATLAELVSRRLDLLAPPDEGACTIPLRADGNGAPLFCFAESHAQPLQALALAYRLGDGRPVWSLVPARDGSCQNHLQILRARPSSQPLLLLAAGRAATEAATVASDLAADHAVVLVLVAPAFPPDTLTGAQKLLDRFRRAIAGSRRAAPPPHRSRTILVSAEATDAAGYQRFVPGAIERVTLPGAEDALREPSVSQLAEILCARLPHLHASVSDDQAGASSRVVIPSQVGDRP